jgi:hypothetical protein
MMCPKCKTDSAHRSHRTGLRERLSSIMGYYPYRCRQCKHRFLGLRHSLPEPASPATRSVEREISHTQGVLRWKRKRRNLMLYGTALILFGVILYFLTRAPKIDN